MIVLFYNLTKAGIDTYSQNGALYSRNKTCRRPLAFF